MTILDVIVLLIIAGLCGALGQAITGFSRAAAWFRSRLDLSVRSWNVAGAPAGLPELFTIQIGGTGFPIIWSIIGSALFVAIISLLARSRP